MFGHFKISGHSGTDFKHRKGFEKIKELQNKNSRIQSVNEGKNNDLIEDKEYRFKNTISGKIIKFSVLILAIIFLATIVIILKNPIQSLYNPDTHGQKYNDFIEERQEGLEKNAYRIHTEEGNNYLNENLLDLAQSSYMKALEINNQDKKAYIGLTRALVKKCVFLNDYCTDANSYLEFIEKKNFLESEEIDRLKSSIIKKI